MIRVRNKPCSSRQGKITRRREASMPPQPFDRIWFAERPTAGHAGSEACGEVVRPGGVCGCGTTRVRLPIVGEYYAAKTKPSPLGSLYEAGTHRGDLRCL